MIDISPRDLTTLKRILAKYIPGCEVRIFGSRQKGEALPLSDLDLVALGDGKFSRNLLNEIKSEFQESNLSFRVDLIDWHRITSDFQHNIHKEYEIVQSTDEYKSIPSHWKFKKVSEIAQVINGGTPNLDNSAYWDGEIPWLTPMDLSEQSHRFISKGKRNISQLGIKKSRSLMVPGKTVLLSTRPPIGHLALAKNKVCTNQEVTAFIVNESHDPEFVYYLFLKDIEYLKQHQVEGTFTEIPISVIKQLNFLIPPLPEQKAITKILETLDQKIDSKHPQAQSIKDSIYPKFMNGETSISKAQKLIAQ